MSEKKGERRELKARIPVVHLEQLERIKQKTGRPINELFCEAIDVYLDLIKSEDLETNTTPVPKYLGTGTQPGDKYVDPTHQPGDKSYHDLGTSAAPGDRYLGTGAQLGVRYLPPNPQPGDKSEQEAALVYAQHLLEQKRSQAMTTPTTANQAIEASMKTGVLQRLQCSENDCKQGAARSIGGKSYCAHHASLKEFAQPQPPSPPPLSQVELPACDVCYERRFLVAERDGKLAAERCPHCLIDCQSCEKGLVLWTDNQGYEKWLPCGCRKAPIERQLAAIQQAELPGAFASLLFGKLPPIEMSDSQKNAHLLSWEWARKFTPKEKRGFFFYGSPGTGKTLSLCRALALLLVRGSCQRVRYLHFPAWLDLKKQSFGSEDMLMECASELVGPEVLLVDEILLQGKNSVVRSFTEWERSQFDLMVHNRWLAGKPTLYATNYKPEQVEAEVSESTWSRIRSSSVFFEILGKDMRLSLNVLPFSPR